MNQTSFFVGVVGRAQSMPDQDEQVNGIDDVRGTVGVIKIGELAR